MSQLKNLKSATSIRDVANLLGFKPPALSYILYKMDGANKYTSFEIPKRYGGVRKILAPLPELKLLQRRLSDLLQNCLDEINSEHGLKDNISHGFKRKHSIITNAKQHRNRRYVFNIDLRNFFGAINFGRVRGYFINDFRFALHPKVATIIAQIACYENSIPQGSPCSPILSNLIGNLLDIQLVKLASSTGCSYSRYADDLTFSTNKKSFPSAIAKTNDSNEHEWVPGKELLRLIKYNGFELNPIKTRMQYRDSRQEVTGLVVNKRINVRSEYRHTVRAMVHRLYTTGGYEFVRKVVDKSGSAGITKIPGTANQLHGMLGFIHSVDIYNDKHNKADEESKQGRKPIREQIYRRFLMYKDFYAATMPVIICEGKTDNVYLLHAIRSLFVDFPLLATKTSDGEIKLCVRIYKYSESSTGRILGITGGTSPIAKFIHAYLSEIKQFSAPVKHRPCIILVDNDSGAKPVYKVVANHKGVSPTGSEPFIHVAANLYLVATPIPTGKKESMIEDYFDDKIKATIIGGKSFDPHEEYGNSNHYGKIVFAHKVVRPNADKIDFSGFKEVLTNLSSAISEHSKLFL